MNGRRFLDTNIFIYAVSSDVSRKRDIARDLIGSSLEPGNAVISYQVVQEFIHVALTKFAKPLAAEQVRSYMSTVFRSFHVVHSSLGLCSDAIDIRVRHKLSWYDSLIVAAAAESKCPLLYSEDLQHGATVAGVRIENPFLNN
jgi:predicted nucleic acid-binding protein